MGRPIDHAYRAEQEVRVWAARARLEAAGKRPTCLSLARALGWSETMARTVIARLVDQDNWPELETPAGKPESAPQILLPLEPAEGTTQKTWEARESMVLATRSELEKLGKPVSAAAIARVLGWSKWMSEEAVRRLRAKDLWPDPPPVAATFLGPGPLSERIEKWKSIDVKKECAEIRENWSAETERTRREGAYGYQSVRIPRSRAHIDGRSN